LSGVTRRYVEPLDLLETTDTLHRPFAPAVFTPYPGSSLTVHAAYNGYWFWGGPRWRSLPAGSTTRPPAAGRSVAKWLQSRPARRERAL
jgi:hypothetical protein